MAPLHPALILLFHDASSDALSSTCMRYRESFARKMQILSWPCGLNCRLNDFLLVFLNRKQLFEWIIFACLKRSNLLLTLHPKFCIVGNLLISFVHACLKWIFERIFRMNFEIWDVLEISKELYYC